MTLVFFKCVYSSILKTCRLRLTCKSFAQSLKFHDLKEMSQENLLITNKSDPSLNYISLEVLGNTSGLSPCGVSLHTPYRSYLFNCGEGMQKVMSEYKVKPSKIQDIFITYPSWKNIGGLLGATLSMQESRVKYLTVHGHGCLGGLFDVMKYIINFKGIRKSVRLCDHNTKFSDEFITVEFVHLRQSALLNLKADLTESELDTFDKGGATNVKIKNNNNNSEHLINASKSEYENKDFDFTKKDQTNSVDENFRNKQNYAVGFIIHTEKSQGSLSFEKCLDFGVPVGPLLGKLKNGEDIQLKNGKIVKSSDVKFPDLPGVIIIVVECPTEDYLDALLYEPAFFKHQSENEEYYACAVVHFSKAEIIKNRKYQEWISHFSKETKHVFVNEASEICAFVGLHRNQFKLNMVHPEIFPPIHALGIPDFPRAQNCITEEGLIVPDVQINQHEKNSPLQIYSDKVHYQCQNNMSILGETLCEINLKPKKTFDYTKCLTLKKNEYLQEMLAVPNFKKKLEDLKIKIESIEGTTQPDKIYPKIVFLGTGSKKPSKTRNSSGILVFLNEHQSIILDCGESTYCQLLIFFGKQRVKDILRSLNAVFISHLHIDHHLGLTSLLLERKYAFDELNEVKLGSDSFSSEMTSSASFKPLNIIAPVQILPILHYLSSEIYKIVDLYTLIPSTKFLDLNPEKFKEVLVDLNLESLQTVMVDHAPNSFGVSLKHRDGWKLTYSGDTRPCDSLVKIGENSDLLIHEATFDDFFEKEAKEKQHTTTGQAILIGRKMNAKFILLTHFSQRYCHLPVIKDELLSKDDVGVAFDFMQVSPYQFPIIPHLYESLKLVFTPYQEKLEQQEIMMKLKREKHSNLNRTVSNKNVRPSKIPRLENHNLAPDG